MGSLPRVSSRLCHFEVCVVSSNVVITSCAGEGLIALPFLYFAMFIMHFLPLGAIRRL